MEAASYSRSLGTLIIGVFLNTFLFGLNSYQFGIYYNGKFNDPLWLRAFVASLLAIDFTHTCLTLFIAWYYSVENYTNPEMLDYPLWAFCLTPIAEVLPAVIVHTFLAIRVYKLTKIKILFGIIMVFCLTMLAFGMATGIMSLRITSLADIAGLYYVYIPWLVFQIAINIILTASLSWGLRKNRTGNTRRDVVLARKLLQSLVPASIFVILNLVTYVWFGTANTNLYACFSLPLGRIYSLAFLDTLIVHRKIQEEIDEAETDQVDPHLSDMKFWHAKPASVMTGTTSLPILRITTPSEYTNEDSSELHEEKKHCSSGSIPRLPPIDLGSTKDLAV